MMDLNLLTAKRDLCLNLRSKAGRVQGQIINELEKVQQSLEEMKTPFALLVATLA